MLIFLKDLLYAIRIILGSIRALIPTPGELHSISTFTLIYYIVWLYSKPGIDLVEKATSFVLLVLVSWIFKDFCEKAI